ncbi:MAG: 16S rRNA (adenine(1518)-N(6)/adenine(1519)-N(6))-dimethyltransferase RsmA, partial [Patescibacteria group bacterium]
MSAKFEHKKSLGQHFLNSDYVPKKMCLAAGLQTGELVLEIGPGTGMLTNELLARGARVIALEADPRAIESLEETFAAELAAGQLTLYHGDARALDFAELKLTNQQYKVISNIPYYISGLLFRTILESNIQPNTLVFLVQKEVATRICRDKKESLLSLGVKAYGTPTYICSVASSHFNPPPKVDSAIIAINNISKDNFRSIHELDFFKLLHLGFGKKRKQLAGNLASHYDKTAILNAFKVVGLAPNVRAEDMALP